VSASRAVRFVLGLLLLATFASLAAMVAIYLAVGRSPDVAPQSTLTLRPSGSLPEMVPDVVLPISDGRTLTVRGYVELIRKAKADRRIASLLLRPGTLDSPYWGKIQEIRDAVLDFRQSGKPVYAFLEYAGDRQYYLASAADKIFLLPTSTLDLTGIASYEVFLRGAFDWAGTFPDFLHVGDFKSAVNTFTEKTFTPAHREMSESLNRDQFEQLIRGIADARHKSEADVRALVGEPGIARFRPRRSIMEDAAWTEERFA
jgi:protease-4